MPLRFGLVPVARYILGRGTLLLLGLPFAVAGTLLWVPVTRLAGFAVRCLRPDFEVTATYKLAALLGGVVVAWVLWVLAGYAVGGIRAALGTALLAPLCGYVALLWMELAAEVKEDTILFLRLQGRPDVRMRFARMRRDLAETFRRLERRWEADLPPQGDRGNVSAPEGAEGE